MKTALLFTALTLPLAATAQKLVAKAAAVTYHVGEEKVFIYHNPADTAAGKSSFFLYPKVPVTIVGEFSPRWAIAKREGFLYLIAINKLADYRIGDIAPLPIDPQTKLITYEGVVQVPGATKADLYARAHDWVARSYRSANDVLQLQDKDAGHLIVKGFTRVASKGSDFGLVRHTLTIYVKDGRYKYTITDLIHEDGGSPNIYSAGPLEQEKGRFFIINISTGQTWADIKGQANHQVRLMIAGLESAMTLKGKEDPTDF